MTDYKAEYEAQAKQFEKIVGVAPRESGKVLESDKNKLDAVLQYLQNNKAAIGDLTKSLAAESELKFEIEGTNNPQMGLNGFWWGFHVWFNEPLLRKIYDGVDATAALAGLGGLTATATGIGIPVAICLGFLAAVLELLKSAMKLVDQGKGVYLSWTWLQVPFFLLPPNPADLPLPTAIL